MAKADPVGIAVAQLQEATAAAVSLTAGGAPGAPLPETAFPRLSLARRVLAFVSDEVDETAYGPRNTLTALTRGLSIDSHTTNPQNPDAERLDVTGSLEDVVRAVYECLTSLVDAGLLKQAADGSYRVTNAGRMELAS
jgi:hypothetical protein